MKCSHPVIYHVDGHLKCIGCGAVLDVPAATVQNAPVEQKKEGKKADDGGTPEKNVSAETNAQKGKETKKTDGENAGDAGEKKTGKAEKK